MLGQKTLGWIDRRCRQSSGVKEHLFFYFILFIDNTNNTNNINI